MVASLILVFVFLCPCLLSDYCPCDDSGSEIHIIGMLVYAKMLRKLAAELRVGVTDSWHTVSCTSGQ